MIYDTTSIADPTTIRICAALHLALKQEDFGLYESILNCANFDVTNLNFDVNLEEL